MAIRFGPTAKEAAEAMRKFSQALNNAGTVSTSDLSDSVITSDKMDRLKYTTPVREPVRWLRQDTGLGLWWAVGKLGMVFVGKTPNEMSPIERFHHLVEMGTPDGLEATRSEGWQATTVMMRWVNSPDNFSVQVADMKLVAAPRVRCFVDHVDTTCMGDSGRQWTADPHTTFVVPVNGGEWTPVAKDSQIMGVAMESGNAGELWTRYDMGNAQAAMAKGIHYMDEMRGLAWLDKRVNEMVRLGRRAVA